MKYVTANKYYQSMYLNMKISGTKSKATNFYEEHVCLSPKDRQGGFQWKVVRKVKANNHNGWMEILKET